MQAFGSEQHMDVLPLRQLTHLALINLHQAVNDTVAVAIACNLTGLRVLDLTGAALTSNAALPAFAQLRHLTRLVLTGNPAAQQQQYAHQQQYAPEPFNLAQLKWLRQLSGLPEVQVVGVVAQ